MEISDAAAQAGTSSTHARGSGPVSQMPHSPRRRLPCNARRRGTATSWCSLTRSPMTDRATSMSRTRSIASIRLRTCHRRTTDAHLHQMQPDNFATDPARRTREGRHSRWRAPIHPLMHRLGPGQKLERQLSVPLPLAETTPLSAVQQRARLCAEAHRRRCAGGGLDARRDAGPVGDAGGGSGGLLHNICTELSARHAAADIAVPDQGVVDPGARAEVAPTAIDHGSGLPAARRLAGFCGTTTACRKALNDFPSVASSRS